VRFIGILSGYVVIQAQCADELRIGKRCADGSLVAGSELVCQMAVGNITVNSDRVANARE